MYIFCQDPIALQIGVFVEWGLDESACPLIFLFLKFTFSEIIINIFLVSSLSPRADHEWSSAEGTRGFH